MKKGGYAHRSVGRVYLYSWVAILIRGAYLGNPLITTIGAFGFYFAATGARLAMLKSKQVTTIDWVILMCSVGVFGFILYFAASLLMRGNYPFGTIAAFFAVLFLLTLQKDARKYFNLKPILAHKYGKLDWYLEHITRMSISFIAAVTAFASIQNLFGNTVFNFLLPTIVGFPLITYTVKQSAKK